MKRVRNVTEILEEREVKGVVRQGRYKRVSNSKIRESDPSITN